MAAGGFFVSAQNAKREGNRMDKTIKVGIVGATGYTGSELLRLLANRSDVEITAITSRTESGKSVTELFPFLRGFLDDLKFSSPDAADLTVCDFVFFATPHGVAMNAARELVSKGLSPEGRRRI